MTEIFAIAPASTRSIWVIGLIAGLLLAVLVLFGYIVYSSRGTRYEVSQEGLAIRGTLYGRTLPWSSLDVERARVVDLREERELQPTLRTNGVGLPGYQAGWFSLRGPGKGLLFVTDRSGVVAVPTRDGYTLLLSAREPDALIAALRRRHAEGSR